jgi:flavodoxin/ferredoxin
MIMKAIIVYYSATGNTAKIARAIHQGMKEKLDCDIVPLKKANPKDMANYDVIGIGGPLWYFRETANLRLFAYNMPQLNGKLGFPFCVHGAAPFGFMASLIPILKKKGLTIIGYHDWYGSVHQVLHMPKPYVTDGHPDEIDLKEAENFGREMAEYALRIEAGETQLIPDLPNGPDSDSLFRRFGGALTARPPSSTVPVRIINLEKCLYPRCTICIDNCAVNAIDFSVNPPSFKKQCINCNLCNRLCPEGVIEVDATTRMRNSQKIINMDKCLYPQCTLCVDHCPMNSIDFSVNPPVFKPSCECDDLCWVICPQNAIEITNFETAHRPKVMSSIEHGFNRFLEEAEANGRFRRLVPLDQIGWDNIIYDNPKHPRFVIDEE